MEALSRTATQLARQRDLLKGGLGEIEARRAEASARLDSVGVDDEALRRM
jgi:hypothetical protein